MNEKDDDVTLTEAEIRSLRAGYLTYNRETGCFLLRSNKTEPALHYLHAATAANPYDVRSLAGRATARERLKIYQKAREDASLILSLNDQDKEGILVAAKCELGSGNFEDALVMFHNGINKRRRRREFVEGEEAIRGIIHKTIGRHAGPALSNLQPYIRKMMTKKESEKKKPESEVLNCLEESSTTHMCCTSEQYQRAIKKLEKQENAMYKIYLSDMTEDYNFFKLLSQQPDIHHFAVNGLEEISALLTQLREQSPIYFLENEPFVNISLRNTRKQQRVRHEMKIDEIHRLINNLKVYKENQDTKKCSYEAEKIKRIVETLDNRYFAIKMICCETVSRLIGQVYLEGLKLWSDLTHRENRERIGTILGFEPVIREEWLDPIIKIDNFPFFLVDQWLKTFKEHISICENNLEKCWLHYEVGRCYYIQKEWDHLLFEAKKSVNCAKLCDNVVWQVNALFHVIIGFCRLKNKEEALDSLHEAQQHALYLRNPDLIEFLSQVKLVLVGKADVFQVNVNDIINRRERTIIRLQKDFVKKERAADLLSRINLLPIERRFPLVPGLRHIDVKYYTNKSIRRGLPGGRLGLHPVTNKSYLQFCGVTKD